MKHKPAPRCCGNRAGCLQTVKAKAERTALLTFCDLRSCPGVARIAADLCVDDRGLMGLR